MNYNNSFTQEFSRQVLLKKLDKFDDESVLAIQIFLECFCRGYFAMIDYGKNKMKKLNMKQYQIQEVVQTYIRKQRKWNLIKWKNYDKMTYESDFNYK